MISLIVPTYNEEGYIGRTLSSLLASAEGCDDRVEIIVVDDGSVDRTPQVVSKYPKVVYRRLPHKSRVVAKNHGAAIARGNILVCVDADILVSSEFFEEISEKGKNPYYVGGGAKWVKLTRYSPGILAWIIFTGLYLLIKQITVGAFWIRREVFEEIGGFPNTRYEDIGLALLIKKYAKANGRKFESLKRTVLTVSTRRFDADGDWAWLRPGWFSPEFIPDKEGSDDEFSPRSL